jgi:preprotein translocase subunit SecD
MPNRSLLWKFGLIAVIAAAALFAGFPPKERIALGLDLQGGLHVLMQVHTDSAIEYELNNVQGWIGNRLNEDGLAYDAILPTGLGVLEIRGTDRGQRDRVRAVLDDVVGSWDIASSGNDGWRITMPADQRAFYEDAAINVTLERMRSRIDSLGVAEPLIQKQGIRGDRILVQLPGVEDSERVKDLLQAGGMLEWKEVSFPPGLTPANWGPTATPEELLAQFGGVLPDDTVMLPQVERSSVDGAEAVRYWPLKRLSAVSGSDLRNAFRSSDEWGEPAVSFELTQDAGKRFEVATTKNRGLPMAIVLDDVVISAPNIREPIRDSGIIVGGFSVTEAQDLALKLKSGALPTDVEFMYERTIGPSLGRDSIRKGLWAGLAGFAGVLVFMVIYYRFSGINAVVALAFNVVLVFGTLGALPFLFAGVTDLRATLTLPGIAGMILTVGMAVDANVLIFERIREELKLGKTVRSAVDQGFGKAFSTILDCNVTTVVAAVFLGMYGTGPVRGFAVTLVIGLAASMFTAIFVSRQLFELVLSRRQRVESLSI